MRAIFKVPGKDLAALQRAMRFYQGVTRKSTADILNRAGRNVSMRSAQFTPKGNPGKIRAEMRATEWGWSGMSRAEALLRNRDAIQGLSRPEIRAAARKLTSAKARSAGYSRVGWAPAIKAFGASRKGPSPRSQAAQGFGKKATERSAMAVVANNAQGAEQVSGPALNRAMSFVARDMQSFAERKLARRFR